MILLKQEFSHVGFMQHRVETKLGESAGWNTCIVSVDFY